MARQLSFEDQRRAEARTNPGWGGLRDNAGRKAAPNPPVHHVRRARVPVDAPAHVILRVRSDVPALRTDRFLAAWRKSLRGVLERRDFRVVHYSIQNNHAHFIVEAPGGKDAMARGMMAVGQRFARCVNRVFRRKGPVLYGRYRILLLRSRRQVRNAIAYVLLNGRKHARQLGRRLGAGAIDPCSSGPWFDGWKAGTPRPPPAREAREVASGRFWLTTVGWRRYGLVSVSEVPGPA